MTARLILLPDTAAALDRLNDCRDIKRRWQDAKRLTDAGKRTRETPEYLNNLFHDEAGAFVLELLAGAVYTDDTDDPRVAALEADLAAVVAYARKLERVLVEDARLECSEMWLFFDDDDIAEYRAEAGVQRIMSDTD